MLNPWTALARRLTISLGLLATLPSRASALATPCCVDTRAIAVTTVPDSLGSIRGRVNRAETGPASNAIVELEPGARRTVAGLDGSFRFDGVPRGTYELRATLATDLHASRRIRVRGGDTVTLEIRLEPTRLANVRVTADRRTTSSVATRGSAPIREIPYSLSVIDSHQLEVQRPGSVNEALRYSAGVQAEQFGGVDNANLTRRQALDRKLRAAEEQAAACRKS